MQDATFPPVMTCRDHAFYLDLDGTLAEIVARPADAVVTATMRDLITRLVSQTNQSVAVVSGRSLKDIDRLMHPLLLPAAGSHGQELRFPNSFTEAKGVNDIAADAVTKIMEFASLSGLLAETKPGTVALHYRSAPDLEAASRNLIDGIAARDDRYRAIHGKMVSELAQRAFDKGTAIAGFADTAPFRGKVPVMVGDDVTDEDGFHMAQKLGGHGIKIGPGPTAARYRLNSVTGFATWLESILG